MECKQRRLLDREVAFLKGLDSRKVNYATMTSKWISDHLQILLLSFHLPYITGEEVKNCPQGSWDEWGIRLRKVATRTRSGRLLSLTRVPTIVTAQDRVSALKVPVAHIGEGFG